MQATCVIVSMSADYKRQWEHLIKWSREKARCRVVTNNAASPFYFKAQLWQRCCMLVPGHGLASWQVGKTVSTTPFRVNAESMRRCCSSGRVAATADSLHCTAA